MPNAADIQRSVTDIATCLQAGVRQSEADGYLAESSVTALKEAGLFKLWCPAELGGPGVTLKEAVEVIEALAAVETTSAWNLAIGAIHAGFAGAYLSDSAVATVFGTTPIIAGQLAPIGQARRDAGGIRVSGRWSFGSGMHQSNWVLGGAMLSGDDGNKQPIVFVTPTDTARVDQASWQVAGLAGTGSFDYSIDDALIADGFFFGFPFAKRQRGGKTYDLSLLAQSLQLHAGLPLGAARHALDEITTIARSKKRMASTHTIAERSTFQTELARAYATLSGARLHMYDCIDRLEAADDERAVLLEARAAARYVTDVALDISLWAYRQAGGSALRLDSALQHIVRDLMGAAQHVFVDEVTLTSHGAALVGGG